MYKHTCTHALTHLKKTTYVEDDKGLTEVRDRKENKKYVPA